MMNTDIQVIFLDHGNTLRVVVQDEKFASKARQGILDLVGVLEPQDVFFAKLDERWKAYRKWSIDAMIEASEKELWTHHLLPDYPCEKIAPLAGRLTRLWRDKDGRRIPPPDVKPVIQELDRRGYILGILANTITETEIPDWLEQDQLAQYFKTVVLSSKLGIKKPNPEIYWEAARRIGFEPAHCAYVGDNPKRDVVGTRQAGFGMIILLLSPEKLAKEPPSGENVPDYIVQHCSELLDIFPDRSNSLS
ncbi:MAG TPA: HAD family hydrolase, partial [Anaerolineales bacterium]|nr:HAD family hydrolase [Anaerolineales bacterium]